MFLEGKTVEQVNTLSIWEYVDMNGSCTEEIRSRTSAGKRAFEKMKSVSYTHLDVYKRQILWRINLLVYMNKHYHY